YLVQLKHARPPLGYARRDLLHDELGLTRLEVRDVDLGRKLELRKLLREEARAEVLRSDGEVALAIRKRRLHDQVTQVRHFVHGAPERVVGGRVAGEGEAARAGVDEIADRGHDVVRGKRGDPAAAERHRAADDELLVAQRGIRRIGNLRE